MKFFFILLLVVPLACAPKKLTFNSAATVIRTADASIEAWADYVVMERKRIKTEAERRALLDKEAQVSKAFVVYQDVVRNLVITGSASTERVAQAAVPLIQTVAQLTSK